MTDNYEQPQASTTPASTPPQTASQASQGRNLGWVLAHRPGDTPGAAYSRVVAARAALFRAISYARAYVSPAPILCANTDEVPIVPGPAPVVEQPAYYVTAAETLRVLDAILAEANAREQSRAKD